MRVEIELNPENNIARLRVDGNTVFSVGRKDEPDMVSWHGLWRQGSDPRISVDGLIQIREAIDVLLNHVQGREQDGQVLIEKNNEAETRKTILELLRIQIEGTSRLADAVTELPRAICQSEKARGRKGRR